MIKRRKPFQLLGLASFTAFMGLLAFNGVARNPRFETIHRLDVIRLMTAGAAVAVTVMLLVRFFSSGPRSENNMAGGKSGVESN